MKRLIDETYAILNEEGKKLDQEICNVIDPIIKKWVVSGFSIVDINWVCNDICNLLCSDYKLVRTSKLIKDRRNKRKNK